jgi:3-oxoacyl-[acyl-carrier protein] reductase
MDLGIRGRKAIICASSKGLGRGCAAALAEAGCDLVVNGRHADVLAETAQALRSRWGVTVTEVVGDVSQPEVQERLLAACPDPDILVNNNGGPPRRDFHDLDRKAIMDGVIGNMITPIELVKAVIDGMAERGFGRIVNITSAMVKAPIAPLALSVSARLGLTGFVKAVAGSYAARNVTINNLLPEMFETDRLTANLSRLAAGAGRTLEAERESRRAGVPAARFGRPAEFGAVCAFYCSAHSGYMTGQNVLLDGGLYAGTF